jgi:hypothetical protein
MHDCNIAVYEEFMKHCFVPFQRSLLVLPNSTQAEAVNSRDAGQQALGRLQMTIHSDLIPQLFVKIKNNEKDEKGNKTMSCRCLDV